MIYAIDILLLGQEGTRRESRRESERSCILLDAAFANFSKPSHLHRPLHDTSEPCCSRADYRFCISQQIRAFLRRHTPSKEGSEAKMAAAAVDGGAGAKKLSKNAFRRQQKKAQKERTVSIVPLSVPQLRLTMIQNRRLPLPRSPSRPTFPKQKHLSQRLVANPMLKSTLAMTPCKTTTSPMTTLHFPRTTPCTPNSRVFFPDSTTWTKPK